MKQTQVRSLSFAALIGGGLLVFLFSNSGIAQINGGSAGGANNSGAALPPNHPVIKKRTPKRGLLPMAQHNGELKEGKHLNLELVNQTGQIYLYAQSMTGDSIPSQKVTLTATIQALADEAPIPPPIKDLKNLPPTPTPRPANATPFPKQVLILQPDTDHYMASIQLRVPFDLVVEAKPADKRKVKPETFVFHVKP